MAADTVRAVNEACTNSVEHAYRGAPRQQMLMHAEWTENEVMMRTVDFGTWRPVGLPSRVRGRGLPMMYGEKIVKLHVQ